MGGKGPEAPCILLITDAKSWGGKGGRHLDNFLDTISDAAEAEGITEEAVRERLWAVMGPKRDAYLLFLDSRSRGGKGGATHTDYEEKTAALLLEGHTTTTAEAHLRGQQGAAMHPHLANKEARRDGRQDSGNKVNLAAVQLHVRASNPSLANFNLESIFSPAKEKNIRSLTYIMPEQQVQNARNATREDVALEKPPLNLNEFKLRTWAVSCLLSDLWYVNLASAHKKTLRAGS